jgi:hypothetical protein
MTIESLLHYRDKEYFDEKPNDNFLFLNSGLIRIAKLYYHKNIWWLMATKATTVKCISMKEIIGLKVHYINHPDITGILGGKDTSWGVLHTSFIYVYWDNIKNSKQPSTYALVHVQDLVFLEGEGKFIIENTPKLLPKYPEYKMNI